MPPPLIFHPVNGQPVHFLEAISAAEARHVVLPDIYYGQLQGVARQLAFSIAGIASFDQLKAVMSSLSAWQANGKTFAQWQREQAVKDIKLPKAEADAKKMRLSAQIETVAEKLQSLKAQKKATAKESIEQAERDAKHTELAAQIKEKTRELKQLNQKKPTVDNLDLPKYRLENIFRTNLQGNYQAGHWEQIIRNQQHRPYLMYDAINDSRTRSAHRAMDNIIRPIDDAFWKTHSPPNGYMCRCGVISLTQAQANARSKDGTGLNKVIDETTMQPDKGWDTSPRDRLNGIEQALDKRRKQGSSVLSSALETKLIRGTMDLNAIYSQADKVKPAFDDKIRSIAQAINGDVVTPSLKSRDRAEAKIKFDHNGDASKIRDILRASIVVDSAEQVNLGFESVLKGFKVNASRNGYLTPVHSSDGYFDAKLDVEFQGIFAEIQIHTKAMIAAKEQAHDLFERRQAIQRTVAKGHRPTLEQAHAIQELNKQMRELFRKAANNG